MSVSYSSSGPDYRELLFKLNLPRFLSTENALELAAFHRSEAQSFLLRGGLDMEEAGFDALFQGLERIEDRRGLYRPITLNMIGLVMRRTPRRPNQGTIPSD